MSAGCPVSWRRERIGELAQGERCWRQRNRAQGSAEHEQHQVKSALTPASPCGFGRTANSERKAALGNKCGKGAYVLRLQKQAVRATAKGKRGVAARTHAPVETHRATQRARAWTALLCPERRRHTQTQGGTPASRLANTSAGPDA